MSAATVSPIMSRADRRAANKAAKAAAKAAAQATAQTTPPTTEQTTPPAPSGQTPGGSMNPPTVPSNSGTLEAEAAARAEALKAATDRAAAHRAALPDALLAIDQSEADKKAAFVAVYEYFDTDKGFAWRNLDGFATMDAAIAHYYKVDPTDGAALKAARDVNTYRRRKGAQFAGALLMGQSAPTTTDTDKASKTPTSDAALVSKYLKSKWGKLSLAEQEAVLKTYTEQWMARLRAEQPERYASMTAPTTRTGTDG